MAKVHGLLHLCRETQKKCPGPSFGLAHLWPLWPFGSELVDGWKVFLSFSFLSLLSLKLTCK